MKVVLFCGGQGLRMRGASPSLPKPMVPLGEVPLILHLMRYYAWFGHTEFVLCLGYNGRYFKEYFLEHGKLARSAYADDPASETLSVRRRDMAGWQVHFVETGMEATIGERLLAVRAWLTGESLFLANYADGLTDCALPRIVGLLDVHPGCIGAFMIGHPSTSLHFVETEADGTVARVCDVKQAGLWANAGYFTFRPGIFDHLVPGEDLLGDAFPRLIAMRRLVAHAHHGFWCGCDTFKDLQTLEGLLAAGPAPWELWRTKGGGG